MDIKSIFAKLNRLAEECERIVFESRWLLLPFILGLNLALCVYGVHFAKELFDFVVHGWGEDTETVVVSILGLVDRSMVATLMIIISKGSFQIFIHKFAYPADKKPGWLDHIDTGMLKVKTAMSIASITGVALLKDFVNIEHIEWPLIVHRCIVHCICLFSVLAFAIIWKLTSGENHGSQHEPHEEHDPFGPHPHDEPQEEEWIGGVDTSHEPVEPVETEAVHAIKQAFTRRHPRREFTNITPNHEGGAVAL